MNTVVSCECMQIFMLDNKREECCVLDLDVHLIKVVIFSPDPFLEKAFYNMSN